MGETIKRLLLLILFAAILGCAPYYYEPYVSGACVDRAIRIQQDLMIRGYETEIVFGMVHRGKEKVGHAWVKYKSKETGEWKRLSNY